MYQYTFYLLSSYVYNCQHMYSLLGFGKFHCASKHSKKNQEPVVEIW